MRIFLKLNNNIVVGQLESDRIPGPGPGLPPNTMEVTDRTDGPWLGKLYNPGLDIFSTPIDPPPSKGRLEITKLPFSFQIWQLWKATRLEATLRAAPAALITALTNREDASWQAYVNDLQEWRQAN